MNLGDASSSTVKPTHLKHVGLGQLGLRSVLAATCSSFLGAVVHVGFLIPKKEVLRSHAGRVIAAVANHHAFRNWPKVKLVGVSVGAHNLAVHKCSVAGRPLGPKPNPALAYFGNVFRGRSIFVHFGPESFFGRIKWHTNKTPITPKLKPAQESGSGNDRRKNWCFLNSFGSFNAVQIS